MEEDTTWEYQQVYLKYAPRLLLFARKFVSDLFVEDIVQDIFLKLWDRQLFLLPDIELSKLLYVSVRNACINHLQQNECRQDGLERRAWQLKMDEINFLENSEELFIRKDLLMHLEEKIAELPQRSQQVFRMFYLEGAKASEIAETLNLSVRTVENLLYRSLLILRKQCGNLIIYLLLYKFIY